MLGALTFFARASRETMLGTLTFPTWRKVVLGALSFFRVPRDAVMNSVAEALTFKKAAFFVLVRSCRALAAGHTRRGEARSALAHFSI